MNEGIVAGAYTMISDFNREFSKAPPWENSKSGHPVRFSPAYFIGPISTIESSESQQRQIERRVAGLNKLAKAFKSCVKQWITTIGELAKTYVESSVPSSQACVTKLRGRAWLGHELMTNKVRGESADSDSSRRSSGRGGKAFELGVTVPSLRILSAIPVIMRLKHVLVWQKKLSLTGSDIRIWQGWPVSEVGPLRWNTEDMKPHCGELFDMLSHHLGQKNR